MIPNPCHRIPGFGVAPQTAAPHHFVPGFPVMARPMVAWVLDTCYRDLFHREAHGERALRVDRRAEAELDRLGAEYLPLQ